MKNIAYSYDKNGYFLGAVKMQVDQMAKRKNKKEVFLLPAMATLKAPPKEYDNEQVEPAWDGKSWNLIESRKAKKLKELEAEEKRMDLLKPKYWLMETKEGKRYVSHQAGEMPEEALIEIPMDLLGEDPSVYKITGKTKKKISIDEAKKADLEKKQKEQEKKDKQRMIDLKSAYHDIDSHVTDTKKLKKLLKDLLEQTLGGEVE